MEKILIGEIVNVVGLKGEVKVYCYTDRKERFAELETIWADETPYAIEQVRDQKNVVLLKLAGVSDRNAAEALRGRKIYMDAADLQELPEDTYYVRDLIGLQVWDRESGLLGTLSDVVQNSAQDLYQVKREDGRILLIPAVKEFVLNIDLDAGQVTVKLPQGLTWQ